MMIKEDIDTLYGNLLSHMQLPSSLLLTGEAERGSPVPLSLEGVLLIPHEHMLRQHKRDLQKYKVS